jgi:preprotein translocase subunit YajC
VLLSSHIVVVLATSTGTKGSTHSSPLGTLVPLVILAALAYLLFLRPARARQRKALEQRAALAPGVEVTTTAGLIADVVSVDDDVVTLEIAPGVRARFLTGAVARVNTPIEPEPEPGPEATGSAEPTGPSDNGPSDN